MNIREDGFEQIEDGKGIELESSSPFLFKCCNCGLTHMVVICSQDEKPIGIAMKVINREKIEDN